MQNFILLSGISLWWALKINMTKAAWCLNPVMWKRSWASIKSGLRPANVFVPFPSANGTATRRWPWCATPSVWDHSHMCILACMHEMPMSWPLVLASKGHASVKWAAHPKPRWQNPWWVPQITSGSTSTAQRTSPLASGALRVACSTGCQAARKRCSVPREAHSNSICARSTWATRWIVSGTAG